jgi:hypothetical protein
MRIGVCAGLLVSVCLLGVPALSQEIISRETARPATRHEFGVWGGASPSSPVVIGTSRHRKFSAVSLRYSRLLMDRRDFALRYTFDVLPLASVTQPRNVNGHDVDRRERIFGAGFAPLGLQLNLRNQRMLQPFIAASAGSILFTRPVPASDAAKFNFMFDLGAGVQMRQGRGRVLTVGWKYHHISNAYRMRVNPGIDSNMFYTGVSFTR